MVVACGSFECRQPCPKKGATQMVAETAKDGGRNGRRWRWQSEMGQSYEEHKAQRTDKEQKNDPNQTKSNKNDPKINNHPDVEEEQFAEIKDLREREEPNPTEEARNELIAGAVDQSAECEYDDLEAASEDADADKQSMTLEQQRADPFQACIHLLREMKAERDTERKEETKRAAEHAEKMMASMMDCMDSLDALNKRLDGINQRIKPSPGPKDPESLPQCNVVKVGGLCEAEGECKNTIKEANNWVEYDVHKEVAASLLEASSGSLCGEDDAAQKEVGGATSLSTMHTLDTSDYTVHQFIAKDEARELMGSDDCEVEAAQSGADFSKILSSQSTSLKISKSLTFFS